VPKFKRGGIRLRGGVDQARGWKNVGEGNARDVVSVLGQGRVRVKVLATVVGILVEECRYHVFYDSRWRRARRASISSNCMMTLKRFVLYLKQVAATIIEPIALHSYKYK
jgi:hypothetical protein